MNTLGKLVLLIGPSGVGKSAIMRYFQQHHPELHYPKSATTRARRTHEIVDMYHFVSDAEFDNLLDKGEVLEYAVVHGQARYGTLKQEILPYIEQGKIVFREVDVQGFESIRHHQLFRKDGGKYMLQSIFIAPESKAQLIKHITERSPMNTDELNRRMASMEHELQYEKECDVCITNYEGQLKNNIEKVRSVIFA